MTTKIICDNCGASLDDSGSFPRYRTSLTTEKMPNFNNTEFSISVYPRLPLGRFDFCGLDCLSAWIATQGIKGDE